MLRTDQGTGDHTPGEAGGAFQVAFAVGVVFSVIGAIVSAMRGAGTADSELGQPIVAR